MAERHQPGKGAKFKADQCPLSLSAMYSSILQHPSDILNLMPCIIMPAGKSYWNVGNRYAWRHAPSDSNTLPFDLLSQCVGLSAAVPSMVPQATQEVVSRLPETTTAEFNAAVAAAKAAFPAWRATAVPTRQRVMLKFQELIRANWVSNTLDIATAAEQWVGCLVQ